jgi:hypothetical protein
MELFYLKAPSAQLQRSAKQCDHVTHAYRGCKVWSSERYECPVLRTHTIDNGIWFAIAPWNRFQVWVTETIGIVHHSYCIACGPFLSLVPC